MSDIVPFVAAAIRDKVVNDVTEENDSLRDEISQLKRLLHERNPF